jgi:hypothetical protein
MALVKEQSHEKELSRTRELANAAKLAHEQELENIRLHYEKQLAKMAVI